MSVHTEPPLTIAALEATPDDGNRYELIAGELHVSTSPGFVHQSIVMKLIFAFHDYLRAHPIGDIAFGVGVIFDDFNAVIPDFVFFSNQRRKQILKGERFSGAPEIVVEVLSPGAPNQRRDREIKRDLYSRRGVSEYWIIDPEIRAIELYRKRKEGGLELATVLREGDDLASPILPEFRAPVADFFGVS